MPSAHYVTSCRCRRLLAFALIGDSPYDERDRIRREAAQDYQRPLGLSAATG